MFTLIAIDSLSYDYVYEARSYSDQQLLSLSHCVIPNNGSISSKSLSEYQELKLYVEHNIFQDSNTTFYFMDGIHTHASELLVEGVSNLTLKAVKILQ